MSSTGIPTTRQYSRRDRLDVLEVIQRFAPRPYKINKNNPKGYYSMQCPCPDHLSDKRHPDNSGSFYVHENGQVWNCFGHGGHGNAWQLYKILSGGDTPGGGSTRINRMDRSSRSSGSTQHPVTEPTEPVIEPLPDVRSPISPLEEPEWLTETLAELVPVSTEPEPYDPLGLGAQVLMDAPEVPEKKAREPMQGCTLEQLCAAKALDLEFCRDTLGWEKAQYYTVWAVKMPYPGEPGSNTAMTRYRVGLDKGDKFRWKKGDRAIMYGLWNLEWIRQQGWVVIVEGETDYATLAYYGIPVLALPGAGTYKREYDKYLEGLEVIIWQEPDTAGQNLSAMVAAGLPDAKVIQAPPGAKDPNELMQQAGDGFLELFQELVAEAAPPPDPLASFEMETIRRYIHVLYSLGYIFGWDARREAGAKALYLEGTQNGRVDGKLLDKAGRLEKCAINWWRYKCGNLSEIMLRRNKCGDPACPYCAAWKMEAFLSSKMAEIEQMASPTLYTVSLGKQLLHQEQGQKVADLKAIYTEMRMWMTHLSDNASTAMTQVSRDHMYHLYTGLERHLMEAKILILADWDANAPAVFAEHFKREVALADGDPDAVNVTATRYETVQGAVDAFKDVAQRRGDWDSPESYMVNLLATKGMRLVQGKGIYSGVSGGSSLPAETAESKKEKAFSCPACGFCNPERLPGLFPVATTPVKRVVSELTGKEYITLDESTPQGREAAKELAF